MPDLPDLDLDLDLDRHGSGLVHALRVIARALWWLVWDFGCEWIAWTAGWCCWRVVSLGRFPSVDLTDVEQAAWSEALLVIVTGVAALGTAVWLALGAPG